MNKFLTTAEAILAVPLDQPEKLFAYNSETLKRDWHRLAALWHPDRNHLEPRAQEVLQHINVLYDTALQKIASGQWEGHGVLTLPEDGSGSQRDLPYLRMRRFELGECYVGETFVAYALEKANRDLFDAAIRTLDGFRYADDAIKREVSRALPQAEAMTETANRLVLVLHRKAIRRFFGAVKNADVRICNKPRKGGVTTAHAAAGTTDCTVTFNPDIRGPRANSKSGSRESFLTGGTRIQARWTPRRQCGNRVFPPNLRLAGACRALRGRYRTLDLASRKSIFSPMRRRWRPPAKPRKVFFTKPPRP